MLRRKQKLLPVAAAFLAALVLFLATAVSAYAAPQPVALDNYKDGEYQIIVVMEGGSGRASITSPATLVVKDGYAYAQIEWSSSNYDYMIVDGEEYLPINEDGNSVFEIPVTVMDAPMEVTADTTAMSTPHEIEYTLTFDSSSVEKLNFNTLLSEKSPIGILVIALLLVAVGLAQKGRKARKEMKEEEQSNS